MARGERSIWMVSRVFSPDIGGVQTYARELASSYAQLGWTVSLFVKSSAGPRRLGWGEHQLVDVGPGSMTTVYLRLFRALLRASSESYLPAAIHACTWRAAIPTLPFAVPLIVSVHGREIGRPRGLAFRLMRTVLRRATRIVAVSETTRALLLERMPELADRCVVAWNGTSEIPNHLSSRARSSGEPIRILTVCRLVPRKNVAAALLAVGAAIRAGHRLRYTIVGDGPEMARLRSIVDEWNLGDSVELAGFVDDAELAAHQASADIFLHPQVALEDGAEVEGFGISVADAMARGLVCIVGQDGGPAELVTDGETGFVVDGHAVEEVTDALMAVLADPALRERIGRSARLWARKHLSWDRHGLICLGGIDTLPDERVRRLKAQLVL